MYTLDDGKRYIGQTVRLLEVRHTAHLRGKCPVDNLIRTHPYKLEILWEGPENELDYAEQYFIREFGTLYPNGWNFTDGGNSNKHCSEETKKRHSLSLSGKPKSENHRKNISIAKKGKLCGKEHHFYGKHHKPESITKMKQSKTGKYRGTNNPLSIKVAMCDKETNQIIQIFDGMSEASRCTGISESCISRCCNGVRKSASGYIWRYA